MEKEVVKLLNLMLSDPLMRQTHAKEIKVLFNLLMPREVRQVIFPPNIKGGIAKSPPLN